MALMLDWLKVTRMILVLVTSFCLANSLPFLLAVFEALVDVSSIEALPVIDHDGDGLRIGAPTPLSTLDNALA